MAFIKGDRIKETTTGTGTGTLTLAGAVASFKAFSSVCANLDTVYYCITDNSSLWEVGLGTWGTGNTLARVAGSVLSGSSGAGVLVTFAAGSKDVFLTVPSAKIFQIRDDNSADIPVASAVPGAPAANTLTIFAKSYGGRIMLSQIGPSGLDTSFQPNLGGNKVGWWQPLGNSTVVPITTGLSAATAVGTATARTVASTNVAQLVRRLGFVTTAATAGLLCGIYWPAAGAQFSVGNAAGLGGFTARFRFFNSDAAAVTGARTFAGMSSNVAAFTNVEPSTLTNSIGVAQISTDATQWYIVYGGSAAQTAIALGTTVGAPTLVTTMFELALFAPSNTNNTCGYTFTNLGSGVSVSGTLTGTAGTALPAFGTFLAPRIWRTNNATALAAAIDIGGIYIETDE